MSERELTHLAIELAGSNNPWDVGLADVCRSAQRMVGVSAASVLLVSGSARGVTGASHPRVEGLEELQVVLGEGPACEVVRDGRAVLVGDVALEQLRWPQLVPRVLEVGVSAVFAFPLPLGLVPLGVLSLYRDARGPLSVEQGKLAMRIADAIIEIVLAAQAHDQTSGGLAAPVAALVVDPVVVDQAVGIIAAQVDCDVAEAAVRLRAYAYLHERPVDTVARAVVDRQLRFPR